MRKTMKISKGGQVSIPASIRKRWNAHSVRMIDEGEQIVIKPLPDDPVEAARGAFAGRSKHTAREHKEMARKEERAAELRKFGK